jgi:Ca2+-binding EF-hand superfamily protein
MQINPLLSNNEISGFDINDESKNEKYSNEIGILFNEIIGDLQKADVTGTGKVSEEELLQYLQSKLPPNKQLNLSLFKQLLQDIDHNIDMNIDLNGFCRKFIQAHEELKLNFET